MPGIKKTNKLESIKFSLKAIELLDVSLNHVQKPLGNPVLFQFDMNLEYKLNEENKCIFIVVSIDTINETKDIKFGSITVSCIFEIEDISKYLDKEKKTIYLPEDLSIALNSVALSTTRGVMFSQFRGTFLHNAILPLVDPKSFLLKKPE
jgi:hypothetical protein